jgi:hypothetical protein
MQYAKIVEELKKWAIDKKAYHKSGEMQSMAESVYGEMYCAEFLNKIDELETEWE